MKPENQELTDFFSILSIISVYDVKCKTINQSINKIVIKWQTAADKCTSKKQIKYS